MADESQSSGSSAGPPPAAADSANRDGNILTLSQLIGAPIHALVDAEAQAAMATARFIMNVGFESAGGGPSDDFGRLRMAKFNRSHHRPDGSVEEQQVAIPLLTMLPIPALQIRDAQLDYTVKIVATEKIAGSTKEITSGLQEMPTRGALQEPATLRATFARDHRSERNRSLDMVLKMKVNIEQSDMPEGLARLLNLAGESITQTTITRSPPDPATSGDGT